MNEDDRKQFQELKGMVSKISRGLYGDNDNDIKGLIHRVGNIEQFIGDLNNGRWYVLGAVAALTLVATVVFWVVKLVDMIWSK